MKKGIKGFTKAIAYAVIASCMLTIGSCADDVDKSDMFTFTGMQMIDFLNQNDSTTKFAFLTTKVRLSKKSQSTIADLLSARGNYTCFAPTNEAVQNFIDSVYNTKDFPIELCPDSTAEKIVTNCLIDNKDDEAYISAEFPLGSFERSSFADRRMTCRFDTIEGGRLAIYINTRSRVVRPDNEVENGYVHIVDKVIAPSVESISALIDNTPNLRIFSHLLKLTGWDAKMQDFRDDRYEADHPLEGPGCSTEENGANQPCPEHRNTGYTVFAETDSVYQAVWGVPELQFAENGDLSNWKEIMDVINKKCQEVYPNSKNADPTALDNALNEFVSYHLLPAAITYNQLVIHYNEQGYAFRSPNELGIDAFEYYETLGGSQRRLLKITEGEQTEGKQINRYVSERDLNNYREITVPIKGVHIQESNKGLDYNALNGYYYVIDDVLLFDENVPNLVLNERIRFDICSILNEQITNGFRRTIPQSGQERKHIPNRKELGGYDYFDNMTFNDEAIVNYLPGSGGWRNFQGDEYNIEGLFDVIIRLPPVPYAGTYQVRFATQNVSDRRGMCQFYFGENKSNLAAIGLPIDQRVTGTIPTIGYVADGRDQDINDENDHVMFIHDYMKAPLYFGTTSGSRVKTNLRGDAQVMRRIVTTADMDPHKTYYLRMKTVLEKTKGNQLFIDYLELVPKSVYAGALPEDKW